ncbi:hypothetical protein NC653_011599 [Populus alba x Populus x berolinensis]|uniref:F-box domain-containing protein n=2 Tax=Populus alba x Populus x berolinensis TaxID=444605 RepID=A0AAD6R2U1_9ROSI|nr:hypothetical protein NC653_011599 [Populus alba x Populus x berolinensis]
MPTITTRYTSTTNRLIKKFVASSPKSTTLDALSHLLSPDSTHHPLLYLLTLLDLMLRVLNNLNARSMARCTVVSRSWNRVAFNNLLWTSKPRCFSFV